MVNLKNERGIIVSKEVIKKNDEYYMNLAIKEAQKALNQNEVPIGCIIVYQDEVVASSYNRKELDNIATSHAEILAINKACQALKTWYLDECTLYTTIEPCMMCTGAIIQSRIKRVVYGKDNEAFGYLSKSNLKINITKGILERECSDILTNFFKKLRNNKD